MYDLPDFSTPYHDPWDRPFHERKAMLERGERRVAYFYAVPDNSTFRYRVFNMVQSIQAAADGYSASWFGIKDLDRMPELLEHVEVLVLGRVLYSAECAHLLHEARRRNVRVLFDIDDMVFDTRYVHLVLETLDQELTEAAWHFWFGMFGRHAEVMRQCDGVITTNAMLALRIREYSGLPVAVVQNFLNRMQQRVSEKCWENKEQGDFRRDDRFHMGYFSGTPTHNLDFAIISHSLQALMRKYDHLYLRIVGFLDMGPGWDGLRDRLEVLPLQNYLQLQYLIAETEVNLVPLQQNRFTHCKSELKFFEAAVVGAWTVCSPTYTFQHSMEDTVDGRFCEDQDWMTRLEEVITNPLPPKEQLFEIRDRVLDRYGWDRCRDLILKVLFEDPFDWKAVNP